MTDATYPLLQTKLHRPRLPRDLVVRTRLLEQLNQGIDRPLILVCAPAGFGKTTLISTWLERMAPALNKAQPALPSVWLSLDAKDNDLNIFLGYFIAALRTVFNQACEKTLDLLKAWSQLPLPVLYTTFINELEELPGECILVLDDYQSIHAEAVHNLLNELARHWPSRLHLVLISRINPPLPLVSLRAKGLLTEIRTQDLRFTTKETADYLSKTQPLPLNPGLMALLGERVEGWIAGLRLAILGARSVTDSDAIKETVTGGDTDIAEYLIDEVLSMQFPAIQAFLLKTSILERFSAPLCEAVIGEGDPAWGARACLDWLDQAELFIIPLDAHKEWFRYHQLFKDSLQRKLSAELEPERLNDLHCQAAAWFEQQGLTDEALQHALLAGDLDLAVRLIKHGLREALNRENLPELKRWLDLFPEEFIANQPWLLMIRVWLMHFSWQLDILSKTLSQIEALIDEDGGKKLDPEDLRQLRGQIAALKGQEAYFNNQLALAKASSQDALALIPHSWKFLRGGAVFYLGLSMQASGEAEAAVQMLQDQYEGLADKTDGYVLRQLFTLCLIYLNQGLLENLRQTADLMLQQAMRGGMVNIQGWACFFLGAAYYQWNELSTAEKYFNGIIKQQHLIHLNAQQNGAYGLAMVHQARGEGIESIQIVDLASQADIDRIGFEAETTRSMRARIMLLHGELDSAFRWAESYTAPPPDKPLLWLEVPHLTRVRILLARNTTQDRLTALQILDALFEIAVRTHNTRIQIEILALRAVALDAHGKTQEALAALDQALELSRPGDFIRVFVDLGSAMQALLSTLAQQGRSADRICRILAAFPDRSIPGDNDKELSPSASLSHQVVPDLVEPLTPRELEILNQMQRPISTKEIALQLGITYATVKRHSINVYGKLGVKTRWGAVARATELGILPTN